MTEGRRTRALVVEPQPSLLPVVCKVAALAGFEPVTSHAIPAKADQGIELALIDVVSAATRDRLLHFASECAELGAVVGLMTTARVRLDQRINPDTPYHFALLKPFKPEQLREAFTRAITARRRSDEAGAVYV